MSWRSSSVRFRPIHRRLLRDWHHTLVVILVLAIGVGPATVGLSVRENVLIRPLGHRAPDRLGVVRIDVGELRNHPGLAPTEILELREVEGAFQAVEWVIFGNSSLDLGEETASVTDAGSSAGFLRTLGVHPALGRLFNEEDPWRDVAILSYSAWQRYFSGARDIIGRRILLAGRTREVVGVLPPDFTLRLGRGSYAPPQVDVWGIVQAYRSPPGRGFLWGYNALVRLREGVSFEQANRILEGFALRQAEAYPDVYAGSPLRFTVIPLLADLVRDVRPAIQAALLGVLLLFMTAVVNASALLVLASRKRDRELAIRSAFGAPRASLVADALWEGLILGVVGVALGWLLAGWGNTGVRAFLPRAVPRWETIAFAWGPAALVATTTILGLLLAGVVSVWKVTVTTPWKGLAQAPGEGGRSPGRGQAILVGVQVAMSVALLFGSVQLVRSAAALAATDLGFQPQKVIAFEVEVAGPGFTAADKPRENQQYHLIRDRLRQVPGVRSVGAVSSPPLRDRGTVNTFATSLVKTPARRDSGVANFYAVLPGYFDSVGIRLLQGRTFTDQENLEGRPVAIIDETLARRAFGEVDPIGQTLRVDVPGGSRTPRLPDPRIVGVVRHARVIDPTQEVRPQIYLPFGLWRWAPLYFTVRCEADPYLLLPAARAIVREVGVGNPVSGIQLLTDNLDAKTSTLRSVTILVVVVALSASVLCLVGLFAVASHVAMRERRAIAIRGALGASPANLLREQLRGRSVILALAVPAGGLLSLAGARMLESLVYRVDVWDMGSLLASAALGALIGLLGTSVPARRAARTDVGAVLRAE
jgi:predicted permease